MAIRFRADLRYAVGSGYAAWVDAQMGVRLGMAFHLREGTPGAERSRVVRDVVTGGPPAGRRENVLIDVFWPDDQGALAVDTATTLMATVAWLRPATEREFSWMHWHRCDHDQEPPAPCPQPEWSWTQT